MLFPNWLYRNSKENGYYSLQILLFWPGHWHFEIYLFPLRKQADLCPFGSHVIKSQKETGKFQNMLVFSDLKEDYYSVKTLSSETSEWWHSFYHLFLLSLFLGKHGHQGMVPKAGLATTEYVKMQSFLWGGTVSSGSHRCTPGRCWFHHCTSYWVLWNNLSQL